MSYKKINALPNDLRTYTRQLVIQQNEIDIRKYLLDGERYAEEVKAYPIMTGAGLVFAQAGDYILIDTNGKKWVCKAADFDTVFKEAA